MNHSFYIDPVKKDYVVDKGNPVIDTGLKTPAYIRVKTPRDGWLYTTDSSFGSSLNRLKKLKTVKPDRQVQNLIEKALQPLIDEGRALGVEVETSERSRHNIAEKVKITDASGNQEEIVLIPVG